MRFRDYPWSSLDPRALTHTQAARSHAHEACIPTHCHSTSPWAWRKSEPQRSGLPEEGSLSAAAP